MDTNEIKIRPATEADAAEILNIYAPYITDTAITFEYDVPTLEEFTGRIRHTLEKYPYLVAVRDSEIIGYAYAGAFYGRAAYDWSAETTIYVKKGCRHSGVGKLLYQALETALKNADLNNVPVSFIKSDMFENISEKYDIIVSNPPYIRPDVIKTLEPEVREHDPWLALDGGEDGLSFYRIVAKEGKKHLNSQGMIFMEIGYDQGQAVKEIFESEGFVDIVIKKDLCKNDRVVIGRII